MLLELLQNDALNKEDNIRTLVYQSIGISIPFMKHQIWFKMKNHYKKML